MRGLLSSLAIAGVAALAMPASPAHAAATGTVLPYRVPPGGIVTIDTFDCAAGTTTVVIDIAPQGGAAILDDSAAAVDGAAHFVERMPIDATAGMYDVRIMCKDLDATTIDTGSIPFEVAVLGLRVTPAAGPVGTTIHITGGGCPIGVTDRVFAFIDGIGDDQPVWDPTRTDGTSVVNEPDGSFSIWMTVPARLSLGDNDITVYCVSEGGSALAGPFRHGFQVTEGVIPPTGATPMLLLWSAIGLTCAGVLLLGIRRRLPRGVRVS